MVSRSERKALNALVSVCEEEQERNYASMSKFFDDLFAAFYSLKNLIVPTSIEPTYTGIHLNEKYEENDFLKLVEQFRNNQMLHAKYSLQIVHDALKLHKKFPNVAVCDLARSSLKSVIIVGDLHGSFRDLYYIIQKFGIPGKHFRFVFNGDFVDRGPQQCEVLLTLLYAFLLYPNRVFLNRGNHEDISLNLNQNFRPNFQNDCIKKFGKYGAEFFRQTQELFKYLPLATVVNNRAGYKCFVTHGGISNKTDLDYIASDDLKRYEFSSLTMKNYGSRSKQKALEQLGDILWSDPIPNTSSSMPLNGCFRNSKRGFGSLFGEDISQRFCRKYGFSTIVRSHEVRSEGWSRDQTACFTIFSNSNYCQGTNRAAVFILNQENKFLEYHMFKTDHFDPGAYQKEKEFLLSSFKSYLNREYVYLIKKFEKYDIKKTGWIKIRDWANIISKHIGLGHEAVDPKHLIKLKDNLLPCDEKLGLAKYKDMFQNAYLKESGRKIFQFLDNIFGMIDLDQDGYISRSEAKRAVKKMNSILGTKYSTDFLVKMDKNRDGSVDFKEFKYGFMKAFKF